ncbi:Phosphatidylinositol:ceramide phosphoinositol transferase (IPC synthase) [Cryptotrichosporon argae]
MSRPAMSQRASSGTVPPASLGRMALAPVLRILRRLSVPHVPASPSAVLSPLVVAVTAAARRLDLSRDPRRTLARVAAHRFTPGNTAPLLLMLCAWAYALWVMRVPAWPLKLALPLAWAAAAAVPVSGQFVWPATPVLSWLILFFSARFIPATARPAIHVALLPALESVLYGANISDLQTRFTHPLLDVLAWLPYGLLHFTVPFVIAAVLWVFGPKGSVQYWGRAFGFMNLFGVMTQIVLPCAAPWYEIIHGLTPADYSMPGSPGGLLRIDRVFHSTAYTNAFGSAPLVFGAFPSLHSGCAVIEALFLSHFFPGGKPLYWAYVGLLWWSTMYLSHHYLIDLTGGACLSTLVFYLVMPDEFKDVDQINWAAAAAAATPLTGGASVAAARVEAYELANGHAVDLDEEIRRLEEMGEGEGGDADENGAGDEEARTGGERAGRPKRSVSWGETKVLGE